MTSEIEMTKPTVPTGGDNERATQATLRERVEATLRSVYDPEIPVNIFELGLIYALEVTDDGVVDIKMTLTAPNCPAAGAMPAEVEVKVRAVEGVTDAHVALVWDPPWDKSRMSESARLELGFI
jgi:FeS assembly SUF system protein